MPTKIDQKRAGALSALALFCGLSSSALAQTSGSEASDDPAHEAVYIARVTNIEQIGPVPCQAEELCWNFISELTVEPIEMISGSAEIGSFTFRIYEPHQRIGPPAIRIRARRVGEAEWQLISYGWLREWACLNDTTGRYELAERDSDVCLIGGPLVTPQIDLSEND